MNCFFKFNFINNFDELKVLEVTKILLIDLSFSYF